MSVWDETGVGSRTAANPLSYLYPSKSTVLSSQNRVSPLTSTSHETLLKNSSFHSFENTQGPQTNAWSTTQMTSTNKSLTSNMSSKSSSTTKIGTCLKSSKFHFTLLGMFLGLVLSLGAIIPIVTIWQLSARTTTAAPSASATGNSVSGSLSATTGFSSCSLYFCEQNVNFTTNMTITNMNAAITIQRGGDNITAHGAYTNFPFNPNMTSEMTSSQLTFRFFFQTGSIPAGNYILAAQFVLPGVNRTKSADTYSITTTNICGQVNSISGTF